MLPAIPASAGWSEWAASYRQMPGFLVDLLDQISKQNPKPNPNPNPIKVHPRYESSFTLLKSTYPMKLLGPPR